MNEQISQLASLIRDGKRILVFTGAGISTRSGIPDYRGPQGVWKTREPVYYDEFMSREDKRIEYWQYKWDGWDAFKSARPTAAHEAIVKLEREGKLLLLVTQNIDGLHSKAGTSREKLIEVHGTNLDAQCQSCEYRASIEPFFEIFRNNGMCPLCERCGGFMKPATISFGQALRGEDLERSWEAAHRADLAISLGSTLSVQPAALIPLEAARNGAAYAIVNRGGTEHDGLSFVSLRVEGDVEEVFPDAVEAAIIG
jgi:NAD-dependent deacetylase